MKKNYFLMLIAGFAAALLSQALQATDYTNSIGMEFKNIPAGSFYMGSCKRLSFDDKEVNKKRQFMGLPPKEPACPSGASIDDEADHDEGPQHKVRISKGFQMGVYEVTLGQFKKFIAGAGRDDLLTDDFINSNSYSDSAAVSNVSWHDARDFIRWLNEKEGGTGYRLPTEAEWEYAARAGTTTRFSWGNSRDQASNYAWYYFNAYDRGQKYAHAVGKKKPNPWGLYDMHGNVWEWVQDWYDENYYSNSPTSDPKMSASSQNHVLRGGGWDNGAGQLRSADRLDFSPGLRIYDLGFRLVRQP